jgi:hypothetical protein
MDFASCTMVDYIENDRIKENSEEDNTIARKQAAGVAGLRA